MLARRAVGAASLLLVSLAVPAAQAEDLYRVSFTARFMPSQGLAAASIRVAQDDHLLKKLVFPFDEKRMFRFEGDGVIRSGAGELVWEVPEAGGELRYTVHVDHLRENAEYDARLSHDWALLRGSDLFPPGTTTTRKGAKSSSNLKLRLPPSWKALVPLAVQADGTWAVDDPRTRYDRPSGWMLFGEKLIVRKATVKGMSVRVAGPASQGVRAQDVKALLRWTLPSLEEAIGPLPGALLIVLAADPMWRGGLSGPASLYLHADRPLIESDGTSPVLHELLHVVMSANSDDRADWVVEGLAEYYSLELLRRSGTVSSQDHERTLERLGKKAVPASALGDGEAASGETARAVLIMKSLDAAIRDRTQGEKSLDDVLRVLIARPGPLGIEEFVATLDEVGGGDYDALLPAAFRR